MVGGGTRSPEGRGFAPSGSLLDQAHLLPSLGRGLCPEGGPRNNGEVDVDKPVPKLLPTSPSSNQKGERERPEGKRVFGGLSCSCLSEGSGGPRPSSLHLQPAPQAWFGSGLEAGWDPPFPLASPRGEKAVEGREQRSPGPGVDSNSCQNAFGFLKNNHNSWVKNQFVTMRQPQSEPPQGEIGVPDGVPSPISAVPLTL